MNLFFLFESPAHCRPYTSFVVWWLRSKLCWRLFLEQTISILLCTNSNLCYDCVSKWSLHQQWKTRGAIIELYLTTWTRASQISWKALRLSYISLLCKKIKIILLVIDLKRYVCDKRNDTKNDRHWSVFSEQLGWVINSFRFLFINFILEKDIYSPIICKDLLTLITPLFFINFD